MHRPRRARVQASLSGVCVEGDFAHWHSWSRLVKADGRVKLQVVGSQCFKIFVWGKTPHTKFLTHYVSIVYNFTLPVNLFQDDAGKCLLVGIPLYHLLQRLTAVREEGTEVFQKEIAGFLRSAGRQ